MSINRGIYKEDAVYIYIYVMEYYLAIKRDEIWSFLEPGPRVCYTE